MIKNESAPLCPGVRIECSRAGSMRRAGAQRGDPRLCTPSQHAEPGETHRDHRQANRNPRQAHRNNLPVFVTQPQESVSKFRIFVAAGAAQAGSGGSPASDRRHGPGRCAGLRDHQGGSEQPGRPVQRRARPAVAIRVGALTPGPGSRHAEPGSSVVPSDPRPNLRPPLLPRKESRTQKSNPEPRYFRFKARDFRCTGWSGVPAPGIAMLTPPHFGASINAHVSMGACLKSFSRRGPPAPMIKAYLLGR
jgi:hypothetical protein